MSISFRNSKASRLKLAAVGCITATALTFIGCGNSNDSYVVTGNNGINAPAAPGNPTPTPTPTGTPGNTTAAQFNQQGLQALGNPTASGILAARDFFRQAVAQVEAGNITPRVLSQTTRNDADIAYFFYAVTRVAALAADLPSDGSASELNRVGDFLDALGFAATPRDNYKGLVAPNVFSSGVTGENIRQYILGTHRTEYEGAISNLSKVSQGFTTTYALPRTGPGTASFPSGTTTVEVDFGDVLVIRSAFNHVLASSLVLASYDLGGDVSPALNDSNRSAQSILLQNVTLGNHTQTSLLASARTLYDAGLADLDQAISVIQAEADTQNDDLFNIGVSQAALAAFRTDLSQAQASTTSTITVRSKAGLSTASLSLQNFFDADGLAIRPNLPPITGNKASGLFPGMPFGDVYGNYTSQSLSDPNRDVSPTNGIPDTLQ